MGYSREASPDGLALLNPSKPPSGQFLVLMLGVVTRAMVTWSL